MCEIWLHVCQCGNSFCPSGAPCHVPNEQAERLAKLCASRALQILMVKFFFMCTYFCQLPSLLPNSVFVTYVYWCCRVTMKCLTYLKLLLLILSYYHIGLNTQGWWWKPYMMTHQMETFSALLAICAGNSLVPGEFPAQRPVMRSFFYVFFDMHLNKRLSKQSWGWWF